MFGYIISDKDEINVKNYKIQPFDNLKYTYLNIFVIKNNEVLYKNNIIYNACLYGHVQVLEWFKNSGYEFKYDELAINYVSHCGFINVLEWFKNSGYEFKYDTHAIDWASRNGYIKVLEWFKNSGYKFKYGKMAFKTNFIKILKFYCNNINIKKLIKWSKKISFIKTLKFKTHHKYLKGYQKN